MNCREVDGAPSLCGLERLKLRVENMQMAIATTTGRADIVRKEMEPPRFALASLKIQFRMSIRVETRALI